MEDEKEKMYFAPDRIVERNEKKTKGAAECHRLALGFQPKKKTEEKKISNSATPTGKGKRRFIERVYSEV